jgi:hypothetical protein
MKLNVVFSVVTVGAALALSGCAESQTFAKELGNSVVEGITSGVQSGLGLPKTTGGSSNTTASNNGRIPAGDMAYLFGWMEDACMGSEPPYNELADRYSKFTDSFMQEKEITPKEPGGLYVEYSVKPRSAWLTGFRQDIRDIRVTTKGFDITYHVLFNDNATYRGQPLKEYNFSFTVDTEGSDQKLVFAPNANIPAIWPKFYKRNVEMPWGMTAMGATYSPSSKTISCAQ